ncbi:Putative tyrosine-protein kinase EpsB [Paraburkholderia sabiae]|uniref:polysaccharide biosynthesis tyrosine autokinase n=1 Tax=Paraburkholderia sabiae TaxID=273251 RepID=UPI001CAF0914|nr:polysaccharide biosynthesis tyrosine autokinase [Paraburkholderia sabiae]CAG9220551.1 Putative tyrosine-protein kinase EpsB [Paraburkholderia sabiae]
MTFLNRRGSGDKSNEDEIELSEVIAVLRENVSLIAIVAACVLAIGLLYAFLGTPIYRADAMIQVDDDSSMDSLNNKLGDLASLFQAKATTDAEIELIRSRTVVGETVRRLHLDVDAEPRYFPLIGAAVARLRAPAHGVADAVAGLSGFAWGGERISVAQFDVPPRMYDKTFTLVNKGGSRFELKDPDGATTLRANVGELATANTGEGPVQLKVAFLLSRDGTRFSLRRSSTQVTVANVQKALDVSEKTKQSGIVGVKLDDADAQRATSTVNTIASLYVQRNVDRKSAQAQQMLDFLGGQLPQLRSDLDESEARYNAFRAKSGAIDLDAQGRLLLQAVVDAKTRLLELKQQRADLVKRFTVSHPSVSSIDARIGELQSELTRYDNQVSGMPETQQQALRLMRDAKVNTDLYMKLLDSTQQLRVLKAGQLGNVRTVDYAEVPELPVRPLKLLVILLAAMAGLILGCAAAVGRHMLNRGLESPAEIEHAIDVPVYGIISRSDKQAALRNAVRRNLTLPAVLAAVFPDDVAVESLRSLRTALQVGVLKPENNVVMVTGPRPGVGKSFVSVNLATVLAVTGRKVLLIDADMRRGDIHSYFSIKRKPGFSEVLAGADPDDAIHREVLPNLDVLLAGAIPDRPSEMLVGDRLAKVLCEFGEAYDMVIVDTPPVLAVTDPVLIGKHVAATLMVVRHGRNSAGELKEAARQLSSGGVDLDGVLLTDVPPRGASYGAYSDYSKHFE